MSQEEYLTIAIENHILEVANLFDEVAYSDLQGIAAVKARKIIKLVERFNSANEAERAELLDEIFNPQQENGREARNGGR
jgi:hypothetical protein